LAYEDGGAGGGVQESTVGKEAAAAQGRDENLPPQVNTEVQVLQQGVTKQIMKEGHGDAPPPRHSTCFGTLLHLQALWKLLGFHRKQKTSISWVSSPNMYRKGLGFTWKLLHLWALWKLLGSTENRQTFLGFQALISAGRV